MEILSDATFKGNVTIDKSLESYDLKLSTGQITATNQCSPITFMTNGGGTYVLMNSNSNDLLEIGPESIRTKSSGFVFYLNDGSSNFATIDVPTNSGTIALKSDIPNTSNFALKSEVDDVKYVMLKYGRKLIDFDVPSDCTRFKVGPITDYYGCNTVNGLSTVSASMHKYIHQGDPNELDPNKNLCHTKFANFAELMPANDGYVYINKASGYSISASDKYAVSVIWTR